MYGSRINVWFNPLCHGENFQSSSVKHESQRQINRGNKQEAEKASLTKVEKEDGSFGFKWHLSLGAAISHDNDITTEGATMIKLDGDIDWQNREYI